MKQIFVKYKLICKLSAYGNGWRNIGKNVKGCKESITVTIKERMRKLIPKCEEIIQIANISIMGGLRNSNIAFKLFEALVIQPLLHNFLWKLS